MSKIYLIIEDGDAFGYDYALSISERPNQFVPHEDVDKIYSLLTMVESNVEMELEEMMTGIYGFNKKNLIEVYNFNSSEFEIEVLDKTSMGIDEDDLDEQIRNEDLVDDETDDSFSTEKFMEKYGNTLKKMSELMNGKEDKEEDKKEVVDLRIEITQEEYDKMEDEIMGNDDLSMVEQFNKIRNLGLFYKVGN